jgi:hypothetical protein
MKTILFYILIGVFAILTMYYYGEDRYQKGRSDLHGQYIKQAGVAVDNGEDIIVPLSIYLNDKGFVVVPKEQWR